MFRTIASRIKRDKDYAERQFTLDIHNRIVEGALYDHLPHSFHEEQNRAGEYVPLRDRRPSVRYNLCRLVVDDSVSLLFSEGHFPAPDVATDNAAEKQTTKEALQRLIKGAKLNELMLEAATQGSVGSVAIQMQIFKQDDASYRPFFSAHHTGFLTPTFDPKNPDRLVKMTERYKVIGSALIDAGYAIEADQTKSWFWFQREWDAVAETRYVPQLVTEKSAMAIDKERSTPHNLGVCPWVWVKNLPGKLKLVATDADPVPRWSDIDGACTFAGAIDAMIEAEYQLSQAGRGLKYSMDPTLLLKEPAAPQGASGGEIVKSPSSAIIVGEKGDGKLLELGGSAFEVVLSYVHALRELALENVHGNRADVQKLSAAQSGRAMELMNQALIWLADRLRVSYGEGALLSLLKMTVLAHEKYPLTIGDDELPKIDAGAKISLQWPDWYSPTAKDRQAKASTLKGLVDGNLMSRETAVAQIAPDYDVEDTAEELKRIEAGEEREAELVATKRQLTQNV